MIDWRFNLNLLLNMSILRLVERVNRVGTRWVGGVGARWVGGVGTRRLGKLGAIGRHV